MLKSFIIIIIFFQIGCLGLIATESENPSKNTSDFESSETPDFGALLVNTSFIQSISSNELRNSTELFFPNLELKYDVAIYRIIYKTISPDGNEVQASGAICFPLNYTQPLSMVSWQHGTSVVKNDIPSQQNAELFIGMTLASLGYVAVLPDYLGYGESDLNYHPYLHYQSTASSIENMILAAKEFSDDLGLNLNDRLFLSGYSEGGYATMATHKWIEENNDSQLQVTASIPIAGPYDLVKTSQMMINENSYENSVYISLLLYAYTKIYPELAVEDFFNSEYLHQIENLFDLNQNHFGIDQINLELSYNLTELFNENFLTEYQQNHSRLKEKLTQNSLINWAPRSMVKMIHCEDDEVVSVENALSAQENFEKNGSFSSSLMILEGNNHQECFFQSIIPALDFIHAINQHMVRL